MRIFLSAVFGFFFFTNCFSQSIVISEVYGGGGNSGATYKNDFIELYNPTSSPISLSGWSVQYTSATGTTWQATALSGSIAAHSYYLIQEAAGTGGTVSLPTPDVTGMINMSGTAGKVALVNSITALSGSCPSSVSIVDLVGFGSTASCSETAVSTAPSNTTSIERKANSSSTSASMQSGGTDEYAGNGYDSNNNSSDFVTRSPQPQNSASLVEPDTTAPVFTLGYPKSANLTDVQFDFVVNLNESGKVYYVVLADGASAPSSTQVKAGQDNSGNAISNSGFISVPSSGADFSKTLTGLSPSTSYDVYSVAEDLALNLQANPTKIDVTTNASTTPSISPSVTSINFSGFTDKSKQSASQSFTVAANNLTADVSVTVIGNYLISSDNISYGASLNLPSANFTSPQTVYVKFNPSGNTGTQTGTITHSTTGATSKDVTLSAVGIDPYNQNFNDPTFLSNSGWSQFSVIGAQVWGSTNFGHTCLTGCNSSTVDKAVQINGFSGSSQTNEDWLIAPQLDLTNFVNYPALSFATISAFAGDQLQLKYSSDYSGSGDPSLATWTSIDGKFPASNSSAWTNSTNIILPKTVLYVAFVYTSNTTAASRWTLDDWKVEDVSSYLNASTINFSFGEVTEGNSSPSQNFTFTAQGYSDITVSVPTGYEVSKDNSTFGSNVLVAQADAASGQLIYFRFSPASKQLKWSGSINFKGTGLDASYGSLMGSSYPKAETFNVATYNMEFFGTDVKDASNVEFGPTDDALQVANVTTVLQTIAADVFAVEEIADDNALNQLVSNLSGYSKVVSDRWSYSWQAPDPHFPPQKTGFIYNTSKVQLVSSRVMFASLYDSILAGTKTLANYPTGTSSSFWSSGRLPFMATFDVTVNGTTRRILMIDIHGKSASDQTSYNRRQYDANVLRDSLNTHYKHDNIILLGDFNDDVYGSITSGAQSSYKSFVDDATNFNAITYTLNQSGASTFPSSTSFIDNIIISNELSNAYVNSSTTVEDPRTYINNYSTTTSDHLPVSARFLLSNKADQAITFNTLASKTFGDVAITLEGTSSSGLTVTYSSSDPSVATVDGNSLTIVGAGPVTITASQAGNSDFNAAVDVPQPLIISKADQSIIFSALKSKIFGDAAFSLSGVASSGLTVAYVSSDPTIASISNENKVTILKTGSVSITASQPGNTNYNAATDIVQSFIIIKANQAITFNAPASKTLGGAPFNVSATSTSGLTVSFASTSDKIVIDGTQVTLVKAGRASITASQIGDTNYNPATSIDQSFCINPMKPVVSLSNQNTSAPTLISSATFGNQWYWNGTAINGATNNTLNVSKPGIYTVQVRVDDCVSQFSDNETIIVTAVDSFHEKTALAYPNPAEDYLFISSAQEITELQLLDLAGKSSSLPVEKCGNDFRSNVKELPSGVYVLRVNQNGVVSTLRFIKK
ncbi:MAG: lamin tail domain-containing protein [Bacteroidetes bacterium]|nr:lamin tail domain-containing protein [Bacteroidota bacterium]